MWDHLHSLPEPTLPSDIDVLIFDDVRTDSAYESELEVQLSSVIPEVTWEVVNQATIHTYTGDSVPYTSIEDAMSRWADLVTAVGARLNHDDTITILDPGGGLKDLFELRVTPTFQPQPQPTSIGTGWRPKPGKSGGR